MQANRSIKYYHYHHRRLHYHHQLTYTAHYRTTHHCTFNPLPSIQHYHLTRCTRPDHHPAHCPPFAARLAPAHRLRARSRPCARARNHPSPPCPPAPSSGRPARPPARRPGPPALLSSSSSPNQSPGPAAAHTRPPVGSPPHIHLIPSQSSPGPIALRPHRAGNRVVHRPSLLTTCPWLVLLRPPPARRRTPHCRRRPHLAPPLPRRHAVPPAHLAPLAPARPSPVAAPAGARPGPTAGHSRTGNRIIISQQLTPARRRQSHHSLPRPASPAYAAQPSPPPPPAHRPIARPGLHFHAALAALPPLRRPDSLYPSLLTSLTPAFLAKPHRRRRARLLWP